VSEMVDRVAKRLALIRDTGEWDGMTERAREMWRHEARGVIAEMREPTEAMKAAEDIHWEWPGCGVCGGLREGWYAMIDEALR
jgi:hypothetical protein